MTIDTIECSECHKNKKPYLKGLCKTCYERKGRHARNNLDVCVRCGKRKVLSEGMCRKCTDGTITLIICIICEKQMPYFAKNMCKKCYYRKWEGKRQKVLCDYCDRLRIIHSHDSEGLSLCLTCYKATRKDTCARCGQVAQVAKRQSDGSMLCWRCYGDDRPKALCGICGKLTNLAISSPPICYECYTLEYNQKPETVARKAVFLARRRTIESESNFTSKDWLNLMQLWNWKCAYCGIKLGRGNRSTDHIIPISRGGENKQDNIVPCCQSCNSRKNDRLLSEWLKPDVYAQVILRMANVAGGKNND